ncbi:MAG TPA: hypothetical protein VIK21_05895 [Desulfuromonadaceae bacterium]
MKVLLYETLDIIIKTKEIKKAWNAMRFAITGKNSGHEAEVFPTGEAV